MCPQAGRPLAAAASEAIRNGDIEALKRALEEDRGLVSIAIATTYSHRRRCRRRRYAGDAPWLCKPAIGMGP